MTPKVDSDIEQPSRSKSVVSKQENTESELSSSGSSKPTLVQLALSIRTPEERDQFILNHGSVLFLSENNHIKQMIMAAKFDNKT